MRTCKPVQQMHKLNCRLVLLRQPQRVLVLPRQQSDLCAQRNYRHLVAVLRDQAARPATETAQIEQLLTVTRRPLTVTRRRLTAVVQLERTWP
jgi:hypothetical protein